MSHVPSYPALALFVLFNIISMVEQDKSNHASAAGFMLIGGFFLICAFVTNEPDLDMLHETEEVSGENS